ncbi:ABC transporter substrate-binding protein [Rhodospirillales bacterium]|nr:ABC transporter substrate-binding protein [Rhodospirillales bacterium]
MQSINNIWVFGLRIIIIISFGLFIHTTRALSAEPSAVVDRFHEVLLSVMKTAGSTSVNARYKKLKPEIEKAFNLPFMIRITVGSRWNTASEQQKRELIEAFKSMSVGTYASRFNGYSGQIFKTLKVRTGPKSTRLVDIRIESPNDKSVRITYVMHKFGDNWKIIDVLLDRGISEMAVRVSEYRSILRSRGVGALARALSKKAANQLKN